MDHLKNQILNKLTEKHKLTAVELTLIIMDDDHTQDSAKIIEVLVKEGFLVEMEFVSPLVGRPKFLYFPKGTTITISQQ